MRWIFLACALIGMAPPAAAQTQPPITAFVADPVLRSARLSPDGRHVASIRTVDGGDLLVRTDWRTGETAVLQRAVRADRDSRLHWVDWKTNDRLIFSGSIMMTARGSSIGSNLSPDDLEFRISRVIGIDINGDNPTPMFDGETRRLAAGASTHVVDMLHQDPQHILLSAYGRSGLGLWRANVDTGATEQVDDAAWQRGMWATDGAGNAVLRIEGIHSNQGYRISRRAPSESQWTPFLEVRSGERGNSPDFWPVSPGPGPGQVWIVARPAGRDTAGLYLFDAATGEYGAPHYEDPRMDFEGDVWRTRTQGRMLAACARFQRRDCQFYDEQVGRHIRAVDAFFERTADVTLIDMSDDGAVWLLSVEGPTTAPGYYIYDAAARAVIPVGPRYAGPHEALLSPTEVLSYASRDGAALWGYLTAPAGAARSAAPLVVFVHGGPESRDTYGYDEAVQFFASRGYLVFQPQFRGSGGFGVAFADAGRREWGGRMQHDVTDGVQHLIASGRVDPNRICIVGGSYGGYAALAGVSMTPDIYSCGISINGVSDLREMLAWERAEEGRRSMSLDYWRRSIGDVREDRTMIDQASPRRRAEAVRAPVLIVAGADDTIVPVRQSRIMRDALRDAGGEVRYIEITGEGHSWYSWELENRVLLFTEMESFLARHLGP